MESKHSSKKDCEKCIDRRIVGLFVMAYEQLLSECVSNISGVKKISTDLLREGAPIEPDPPVSHWKPEAVVTFSLKFFLFMAWVFFFSVSSVWTIAITCSV